MTNVEKLFAKQEEMGYYIRGVTLGDNPTSAEELAGILYAQLVELQKAIETGDWSGFDDVDIDD